MPNKLLGLQYHAQTASNFSHSGGRLVVLYCSHLQPMWLSTLSGYPMPHKVDLAPPNTTLVGFCVEFVIPQPS